MVDFGPRGPVFDPQPGGFSLLDFTWAFSRQYRKCTLFSLDVFKMRFGVVLKWFRVVWCVLRCFHGPATGIFFRCLRG